MELWSKKQSFIIGALVLVAFMGIGIFGLFVLGHSTHTEAPMVNCPYTKGRAALCANNFEHINNWQQFSNIILTALFVFLILVLTLYVFGRSLFGDKYLHRSKYYLDHNKKPYSYYGAITRWLSLFENSPNIFAPA